jgi:hypothetical protein
VIGRSAIVLDVAVRCGVIAVSVLLIGEFWGEPEPDSDGVPVLVLVPPLVAYLAWNLWFVGRSIRAWISRRFTDASFLTLLGVLSLARLLWLLPLADDLWWRHRDRLMVLVVASLACGALALGEAIKPTMVRSSELSDPRSGDHDDRLDAPPSSA